MATLPDLTLLFSSKVSLTLAEFLLATSAVLVDSNPCWVATTLAAVATCSSNDFLDSSGVLFSA